jgi:hemerythrin superfamily protein
MFPARKEIIVATPADSDSKTTPRKPAARTRKAAAKPATAKKAAASRRATAAKRAAAPKSVTETVTGTARAIADKAVTQAKAAEKSAADGAIHAAQSVKAAANKAVEAAHVPEAKQAVTKRLRSARTAIKDATTSKPKATKKPAAKGRGSAAKSVGAGTVIGVAAAGLAAGIVANLGRKAAVQAPSVMAGDWLEALKGEHKAALALLDKLAKSKPEQPAKRTLLLTQLKHALGKHAFTEENVIYPALREWGDKADADALNHEQGYHKQYLYELDNIDKAAPEFATKVADFRADLEKHIREEEDKIFPKIHKGLDEAKNKALTQAANREGFKLA